MRCCLMLAALLCFITWVNISHASRGQASCCLKLSQTRIHRDYIKSYYKQYEGVCPITAVVFITIRGKRICSDPNSVWAKTTMVFLYGKDTKTKHANLNMQNMKVHKKHK
ncbi:monocyte chemotactic protein 1B-like [Centropristis striata]|uniref:monocyte chemotactic protein 1B-like n=1 Tax=Centropristis striata TaxID=184440 RepID=UPI0027DFC120|nr:monocyte chemotactic protein 1B-like [Centropristis striata]